MNAYVMATTAQALIDLSSGTDSRCWVEVRGMDVRKFLNGVLTNNIQALAGKTGCYACLLTPKGKMIADLFCYSCPAPGGGQGGDYFGLDIAAELKPAVMETLKKYIVFQKIELIDQSEKWSALAVAGPKAREFLESFFGSASAAILPAENFSYNEVKWGEKNLWVISKKLWGLEAFEIWVRRSEGAALKAALNLPELDAATQEVLRIESATPKFGFDMDESTIPQEAGLYAALSFNKGCYVGQETVARLEHRGHVGKRLVQLKLLGGLSGGARFRAPPDFSEPEFTSGERIGHAPLSKGLKICGAGGEEIGEVTSSCFSPKFKGTLALGYIRYQFLNIKDIRVGDQRGEILQ